MAVACREHIRPYILISGTLPFYYPLLHLVVITFA